MTTDAKTDPIKANHSLDFAVLTLIALTLAAALLPAAALARTTRDYQSSFGSFSPFGPYSLAVDQATGDAYVSGGGNKISRFTAAGAPDDFTAGPNAGTNTLSGFNNASLSVAVDSSGGPMNGAIYVTESANTGEHGKVRIFASSGASLGTIGGVSVPGGGFSMSVCGVAVDQSDGAVYVSEKFPTGSGLGHIWRYAPSSPSGSIDDSDYTVTGISVSTPCAVAAGSGSIYSIHNFGSIIGPTIDRYAASSFTTDFSNQPQGTKTDTGPLEAGPTAIAVDPKTGDLYVDEGHRVAVFDSSGTPLYGFGAAADFGNISEAIALKSSASGPASAVYVADPQKGSHEVDVFGGLAKTPTFTHPEIASFGPDGTAGSSFSANELASSLAFDQAARRLYAVDGSVPGVYGFDASAPPSFPLAAGFSPLATAATGAPRTSNSPGVAVDNTTLGSAGNLYLASGATGLLYGWSPAGSPLGGAFPVDPAVGPGAPDGSPKDLCAAAVDSAGNVWVANRLTKRILKYSPSGASLPGAIDTSGQGAPCQLAFDTNDDLYVTLADAAGLNSGIWKYTAASGYASASRIAASDSQNGGGNDTWLAVDPSNHHLYVTEYTCNNGGNCNIRSWIDEYDASGNLIDEFALGSGGFGGLSVDATNHNVYVAESSSGKIRAFGPGVILPEVTVRPATGQTNTTAVLKGLVNGQELALSDCRFEYVTEAAFRTGGFSNLGSGGSVPCSPAAGSIPLDFEEHAVSATASGLSENTKYRFRLSATNGDGAAVTADAAFSTAGRPIVETTGSPVRTTTTARLDGRLDAHGVATTYHFEYGDQGPCDSNPCTSTEPVDAGAGEEIELVSQQVEGLAPNTTYHYRLIADNGNPLGTGTGADMTVSTRISDAPLTHGHFAGPPASDRAYEQVSLPDTGGNPVNWAFAVSDDGNRAVYKVSGGTPISSSGTLLSSLYAQRSETAPHVGSWRSEDIGPKREEVSGGVWLEPAGKTDLSDQLALSVDSVSENKEIWRLRPGQPAVRIFQPKENIAEMGMLVSDDASRVIVSGRGSMDPDHPLGPGLANLYDVSSGTPHLVGFMPDGSLPSCSASVVGTNQVRRAPHWLTPNGSLLFFEACNNLYVRDLDAGQTKLIANNSSFAKWTPAGVFFLTNQSLEAGDAGGSDFYRYDTSDGALKCVTCVVAGLNADVVGGSSSSAVAADGSHIYFFSSSTLLPGAAPGVYRLKVDSGGLAYVGLGVQAGENVDLGQAMTPDGSALVFASADRRLNAVGGQQNGGTLQYYRYDDRDRSLVCLSCPQDGSAPLSSVQVNLTNVASVEGVGANRTALSADGRTFAFATTTSLLSADQNTARAGQQASVGTDVYEWRDGRLLLITDGLVDWPPSSPPYVSAITPSGNDLFFVAAHQYTQDALDGYLRLYDARIGGGFEVPPTPKPCPLEVCQGTPKGAPEEQPPGTGSFAGPGNSNPQAHHKKKKAHKKKSQHKKQSRHAKHNRGNAR